MKSLTSRQKNLMKLLISEEDYKTIEYYSDIMGVSERTIHNDLKTIRDSLSVKNVALHKKPGVGIKIQAVQKTKLSLLNELDFQREEIDPLSTKIRTKKIILQLFYSNEATSLQKLSDEFMVSKTSIVKDLEKIEHWLRKYDLKLIKNREGTKVKGSEENIRKAIAGVIDDLMKAEQKEDYEPTNRSRIEIGTFLRMFHLFKHEDIQQVKNIIEEAEKRLQYNISEPYYINLITHILILIQRIKNDNKLVYSDQRSNNKEYTQETYPIAEYIAMCISQYFSIEIPNNEVIYINQYLMCAGIENNLSNNKMEDFLDNITNDLKLLVQEMIAFSSRVTNINLNNDPQLYLGLIMHIKPMINRLRLSIHIENPLLEEVKNQYSAMFGMTWLICSIIERKFNLKVNEDEIGYLTMHFQAAIERSMDSKKVVVVCPGGMGTSQLIANRIKRFVPQLEIVDVVSINRLNSACLDDVDFIISTVPLNIDKKHVIIISSLVNKVDLKNINNFFVEYLFTKKNTTIQCDNLLRVLDQELIFTQLEFQNKTDVINFLCQKLKEKGHTGAGFKQSLINRENIAPTSLGNGVAIPHGEDMYVNTSKVVIATLKNEVNWGKENVKLVFLMAMKLNGDIVIKDVLTDLYSVFDSEDLLNKMVNIKTPEELMTLLIRECHKDSMAN